MNLLMNGAPLLASHSGVGNYIYQLSRALSAPCPELRIIYHYGFFFEEEMRLTATKSYVRLRKVARKLLSSYRLLQAVREMTFRVGCLPLKIDLYHETNYIPMPFQGPIVVTVFDLSLHLYPETHPQSRLRFFQQYFYKRLSWATHFITISESTKVQMVKYLGIKPEKIFITYLGHDFKKVSAKTVHEVLTHYGLMDGSYILYVGTLEPRKNITTLLQAYSLLSKKTQRDFRLVLAGGKGWMMDKLEDEINHLGIASTTILTGYVPREHLPALYSGAVVCVYPSLYEGFGLPAIEAMACGTPVIASNVTSLPEVVGDAGVLVDPYNVKGFSDAIQQLIDDPSYRTLLSTKGLQRAKQFTWEDCARRTMDVYRHALNGHG